MMPLPILKADRKRMDESDIDSEAETYCPSARDGSESDSSETYWISRQKARPRFSVRLPGGGAFKGAIFRGTPLPVIPGTPVAKDTSEDELEDDAGKPSGFCLEEELPSPPPGLTIPGHGAKAPPSHSPLLSTAPNKGVLSPPPGCWLPAPPKSPAAVPMTDEQLEMKRLEELSKARLQGMPIKARLPLGATAAPQLQADRPAKKRLPWPELFSKEAAAAANLKWLEPAKKCPNPFLLQDTPSTLELSWPTRPLKLSTPGRRTAALVAAR